MTDEIIEPPRRTPFIGLANASFRAGQALGLAGRNTLDRDELLENAQAETGLTDFGDNWFLRPMDVLIDTLKEEARLNPSGWFVARKQFEKVLIDRLRAQQFFREYPEILGRPLPRPIIVVGPMRSGTTRMHRLLASDQRFSYLRTFETISPVPPAGFEPGDRDGERPAIARKIARMARLANPRTLNIHPTGPMEPEEELGLLVNSFWGMKHEVQWAIPGYGRWSEAQDPRPAYAQLARLLRLVSWSQQGSSLRPWILKTPQYMLDLDALIDLFPDARFIFTHRDPVAVVGSAASLAWNQTIIYSDHADAQAVGREWLHKTALQVERMRNARKRIAHHRKIDIHFEEMDNDWEGTMRRVYGFLSMDMGPAVPAMRRFIDRSRALKRRPHRYSLGEFGLSSAEVHECLADYIEAFGVRVEDARSVRRLRG